MKEISMVILTGLASLLGNYLIYKGKIKELNSKIELIKEEGESNLKKMKEEYALNIQKYEETKKIDFAVKLMDKALNDKIVKAQISKALSDSFKDLKL